MLLHTTVTHEQYKKLIDHFGENKVDSVNERLEKYVSVWELENMKLIPYYSVNMLWRASSKQYGDVVLKLHTTIDHYTTREITLMSKNIPHYCQLYEASIDDGVLLLKDVAPAQTLHEIKNNDRRLDAFLHVFNSIHIEESEYAIYPSYSQLLTNIRKWAELQQKHIIIPYIEEAEHYYKQLKLMFKNDKLLHGDLHHDNIMFSPPNSYTVIDAKGVYDHPIFDLPRFILNESEHKVEETSREKIVNIIKYLSHKLNYNGQSIAMALCIESILSMTWTLQDKVEPYDINVYISEHLFWRSFIQDCD